MITYVAGFLFDDTENVLLIRKARPDWQRGLLNGIGGHIESGEQPIDAMRREFIEETGIETHIDWMEFCRLSELSDDPEFRVHFFCGYRRNDQRLILYSTETDEPIETHVARHLPQDVIQNLNWLIPMALAGPDGTDGKNCWPYLILES